MAQRNAAADKVEQFVYHIDKNQKRHLLAHLIKEEAWYQVLVFVKTKHGANRLAAQLHKDGIPSAAIHGNKSQSARMRALNEFKKGNLQALIATDIAARGIDLQDLSHVVNYDLPNIPEDYVHRIGRTGRAGKSGIALSLITPEDKQQMQRIQRILKHSIPVKTKKSFKPVTESSAAAAAGASQPSSGIKYSAKTSGNKSINFKSRAGKMTPPGPENPRPRRRRRKSA